MGRRDPEHPLVAVGENSHTRSWCLGSSILLTTSTSFSAYGRRWESSSSSSLLISPASIKKMMASLFSRRLMLRSVTRSSSPSRSYLMPPLSINVTGCPSRYQRSLMASRVTPGVGSVIARRLPTRRLKRVDFPTFGLPMMLITGIFCSVSNGGEMIESVMHPLPYIRIDRLVRVHGERLVGQLLGLHRGD